MDSGYIVQDPIDSQILFAVYNRFPSSNVGTENRDHFTALGPHVNFTQRIESRASKGQILISASIKARFSDHFELKKIDMISDVKNIPSSFNIFEINKTK